MKFTRRLGLRLFGLLTMVAVSHASAAVISINCDTHPSGLQAVLNSAAPGDVVEVEGAVCLPSAEGLFRIPEGLTVRSVSGATILEALDNPISAVVIQSSNVTLEGFTVRSDTNGVIVWPEPPNFVDQVSLLDLTIELVEPSSRWVHGIALRFATNSTVARSTVMNAGANGIYVWEGSSNALVVDNTVINSLRAHGIAIQLAPNATVKRNRIEHVPAGAHGIIVDASPNATIMGNVIELAHENGVYVLESDDFLVANNLINRTINQHGIAVQNSDNGEVLGNKVNHAGFHGILLIGSAGNLVAQNRVRFHQYDGITTTAFCGVGVGDQFLFCDVQSPATRSGGHNLIYANVISEQRDYIDSGLGTGIWANVGSDANCMVGNSVSESAEAAITSFDSSSNYIFGNTARDSRQAGALVWDIPESSSVPDFNLVKHNWFMDIPANGHVLLRGAAGSMVSFNFMEDRAGWTEDFGVIVTSGPDTARPSTATHVANNWMRNLYAGVSVSQTSGDIQIYRNRFLSTPLQFSFTGTNATWDRGSSMGGNFYSDHGVIGNPSQGSPYKNIVVNTAGARGTEFPYIDRYPFQAETLGLGTGVQVIQPMASVVLGAGTTHPVEWIAPACARVDLELTGSGQPLLLEANYPNVGFYQMSVPESLAAGSYQVRIACKTSDGASAFGAGSSGSFMVAGEGLRLLSPRWPQSIRGQEPGGPPATVRVSWAKSDSIDAVDVLLSLDGGHQYTVVASRVSGLDAIEIAAPDVAFSSAVVKVRDADKPAIADSSGSALPITRLSGGQFRRVAGSEPLSLGMQQRVAWAGPSGAAYADLFVRDLAANRLLRLHTNIPACFPYFTFEMPDLVGEDYRFELIFKDAQGQQLGGRLCSPPTASNGPGLDEIFHDRFESGGCH